LAGDVLHNFILPEDCDGNGAIDPLDALVVINRLNDNSKASGSSGDRDPRLVDVDADNALTPLDALVVINHLNSSANDRGMIRASRVDLDRRIERIEAALASDALPPNMSLEHAHDILETLRSGGRPELGDRVVDGVLHWKRDVLPSAADPRGGAPDGSTPESRPERSGRFIEAISERLSSFGVSQRVIDTISSEIKDAYETGAPMNMSEIRDRLEALGVDVESILPQPKLPTRPELPVRPDQPVRPDLPDRPDSPIMPTIMVTEPIAESILARLMNAGITEGIITTISTEIWDGINSGTPMSLHQVRARLEELGVDWERLHAPPSGLVQGRPDDMGDALRRLIPFLGRIGINREVMLTIYNEVRAAAAKGTPMTGEQIIARLKELGVALNAANVML